MATKFESDLPSSPTNNESGEGQDDSIEDQNDEEEEDVKPVLNNNVADLLKRLQSTGALIKKPKQEYRCFTCEEDFNNWPDLENHLIQHVSLPSVVVDKLPSEDEDVPSDEEWSDEEAPPQATSQNTPKKMDISQILKKTGISIKKPSETTAKDSNSALTKLSGLGFTIKKNSTPIKKEPEEPSNDDVMQKLGKLGGIKLKLKSDGGKGNSFKVVNGLKDFKASDEEDSGDEDKEHDGDEDTDKDKSGEQEGSASEHDNDEEQRPLNTRKSSSGSNSSDKTPAQKNNPNTLKSLQGKIIAKIEPTTPPKATNKEAPLLKPLGRPAVKQTPKRISMPVAPKEISQNTTSTSAKSTPERRQSSSSTEAVLESIVVKKEVDSSELQQSSIPLFSSQIKTERSSPPPGQPASANEPPVVTKVKSEPDIPPASSVPSQPLFINPPSAPVIPAIPPIKTEQSSVTIIEINGDSNDEDDDCCVISDTPAPDIKPVVPKIENISTYAPPPPSFPTSQSTFSTSPLPPPRVSGISLEKQHNFNWNAPDSKPPIDMLEKSADDIFESLLSTKKESCSLSEASEYISLDTLGPQHSCDVCNTRFTDISLLEEHKRISGHSRSLVMPTSSTLLPYNPMNSSSSILSSLLPVKQLAEQVGKLSSIGSSGPGYTHQQNVMINIHGIMPPQQYNPYAPNSQGQSGPQGFPQAPNNMYGAQGMSGQYQPNYMGQPQGHNQYQQPMPKPGYPGTMPQNTYPADASAYSSASPLQSMQQAVYGQAPTAVNNQMGQMGPPMAPPGHTYVPTSTPSGMMKPPMSSGVRIQNVQTFQPGQMQGPGAMGAPASPGHIGGQPQMPPPGQIRMAAGATVAGARPRMPNVRNQRPTIRPGVQVHGQVRGIKPGMRMPMKRPAGMLQGNIQKKRPNMLLPGKHDNEDCQVMAMQKQREGLPLIQSVQGAKDKLNLGSQISITKKTVNKEANAMANVLASRGISIKQKAKSRSPSPEKPVPHIPNLGAGMSIKHTSKSSNFSIPEAKVGGSMLSCKVCKKMFMNMNSLSVHMSNAHPQSKVPVFKCEECPASYPKILQLQHHKRVFHNVTGSNKELGLPVVDLSQEDNLKRLSSLGIYSFIPLANREQAGGCFGIPVISVHNAQNGYTNSLQALGADGLLSLGPLKPLPNT